MSEYDDRRPVFLHSMWRTSSTWLFTRFRRDPAYWVFYEPFNEALATLETALDQPEEPSHPNMDEPFFAEYRAAASDGRIRNFDVNFAYLQQLWFDFEPRCQQYIDHLTRVAADQNRIAVLQLNRSFLCLDYFARRHTDGLHLYIYRNPRDQFRSFEHAGRNYYIGLSFLQYAAETSRSPTTLLRRFGVPFYFSLQSFQHTLAFYRAYSELDLASCYFVLFSLWCRGLLNARRAGFPVIGTDPATPGQPDSVTIESYFPQAFPSLDLSGYRPARHAFESEETEVMDGVESLVLDGLDADCDRTEISWLRQLLRPLRPETDGLQQRTEALEDRILDALRAATNANFAAAGGGLKLEKR